MRVLQVPESAPPPSFPLQLMSVPDCVQKALANMAASAGRTRVGPGGNSTTFAVNTSPAAVNGTHLANGTSAAPATPAGVQPATPPGSPPHRRSHQVERWVWVLPLSVGLPLRECRPNCMAASTCGA